MTVGAGSATLMTAGTMALAGAALSGAWASVSAWGDRVFVAGGSFLADATGTPTGSGSGGTELSENQISPGILGFLSIFVIAVGTWLLVRSLTKRLRTVRYSDTAREEQAEQADAELNRTETDLGSR